MWIELITFEISNDMRHHLDEDNSKQHAINASPHENSTNTNGSSFTQIATCAGSELANALLAVYAIATRNGTLV